MQLLGEMHDRNQFNLDENIILAVDNSDDDMDEESECHKFIGWELKSDEHYKKNIYTLHDSVLEQHLNTCKSLRGCLMLIGI